MAIYHLSANPISRSQGRSVVAAAAYRSGNTLYDERYDKVQDYSRKEDIVHTEVLLPESAPQEFSDRQTLWNTVERIEKRKDAQLAREVEISLPRELTLSQNIALTQDFVKEAFVSKGMIADVAIHNHVDSKGEAQPHAHILLTLRDVSSDGFGLKNREWNDKAVLCTWRELWQEKANYHLALNGHDLRIDHRTLAEQGIALEPQYKIGTAVAKERMARFEDHERIARENGARLLAEPEIALQALTHYQATFSHQDLAKFVHRHTGQEQFQEVLTAIYSHPDLIALGLNDKGQKRFTTVEMIATEAKMLQAAINLEDKHSHAVEARYLEKALSNRPLNPEQQAAFTHITASKDISCLVGFAGTGKSYLLGSAREAWEAQGYRVRGATLSGIAAQNLESSSGIESRTLASHMYYWNKGEELLTAKDIVVVDEAGLIGSRQMSDLLRTVQKQNAKIVLIGDPEQLQAIEAGAAFRGISDRVGYVELTDIRRQNEPWQQEATKNFALGNTEAGLIAYGQNRHVREYDTDAQAKQGLIRAWDDARTQDPNKSNILLAYTRKDARELNEMARALRKERGELGKEQLFETERGERNFAEHDRIYFLKNDRQLGVKNGSLGTVKEVHEGKLTVALDNEDGPRKTIEVSTAHYNNLDHGYAATIHKAQGVTVDRSFVLASQHFDRHATYVAMTRHRESADLFYSLDRFKSSQELKQTLSRERAKDITADYTVAKERMADRYGVDTEFLGRAIGKEEKSMLNPSLEKAKGFEKGLEL